ncbi:MAG: hypothetical protein LBS54_04335 [Dysgonamonadaceae bacterium]|jgi:hypothetical protein|nr:hypothetical protein [Dysgonamonadaceae bacterium]
MKKSVIIDAYWQVPRNKGREVLDRLGVILGVTTDAAIRNYINGVREPKISEAIAIKHLFQEYGIKIDWESSVSEETTSTK